MTDPVRAANALTARWAARCDGSSTVLSGACAWPLLALLAASADGPGRAELEAAAGTSAPDAAVALLDLLGGSDAVRAALGIWSRPDLPLRPEWLASLPPGTHGVLTGQDALDAWASARTDGRIPRMPVSIESDTRMLLASALLVRTAWSVPFREAPVRWEGREVPGLARRTYGVDDVAVHDGVLTSVRVAGEEGVDVHLVLGPPEAAAGEVLAAGIAALAGGGGRTGASDGPGLSELVEQGTGPTVRLALPGFAVSASHDLLATPDVFGLGTVSDAARGHFPGISPEPLAVGQARQDAVATFTATGFEAAAVTAVAMSVGSAPPRLSEHRVVVAAFDRPFGFVAAHRDSGLVLAAGWVGSAGEA